MYRLQAAIGSENDSANIYSDFVNYLPYDHMHMRRNIAIHGLVERNSERNRIKQLCGFLRARMRRQIIRAS